MAIRKSSAQNKSNGKGSSPKTATFSPARGLQISKSGLAGLNLDVAFSVLLSDQEDCFCHKEILWAGICAWIKRSSNQSSAKKAIAKQTARAVMLAEQQTRADFIVRGRWAGKRITKKMTPSKRAALNGIAYTWAFVSPEFQSLYQKVYFPIGGMEQIVGAFKSPKKTKITKTSKERSRPRHTAGLQNLTKVAAVFDHHYRELSSDEKTYGKPSIEKASKALSSIAPPKGSKGKMTGLGRSQVQELLREHRNAFALLYGAQNVVIGDKTLLHCILRKAPLADVVEHLPEWLSYTRYFWEKVLAGANGNWTSTFSHQLTSVRSSQPKLQRVSLQEADAIKTAFQDKCPSQARLR